VRHLAEDKAVCSTSCSSNELIEGPQGRELEIYRPWQRLEKEAVENIEWMHGQCCHVNETTMARMLDIIQEVQCQTSQNIKTQQFMHECKLCRIENEKESGEAKGRHDWCHIYLNNQNDSSHRVNKVSKGLASFNVKVKITFRRDVQHFRWRNSLHSA